MLSPLDEVAKVRSFLTFDLEWRKGERKGNIYHPEVTLVGVDDGSRYRHYYTIEDFLDGELTHKNRGKWFYAHAGGLADMIFVLEILLKRPEYQVEASFSGSSAIIVRVMRGKNKWVFVDSYWLLRDRLANIAKFVGMEKGDVDFQTTNMLELIEYNELDCRILWRAIDQFQREILSLGGQLQMTLASCSMNLFRRKYLKRDVMTSDFINQTSRLSYIASRVEVFQRTCEEAHYYDINSSFPHAMTYEAPGGLIRSTRVHIEHDLTLVDATIEVPDMYFPPLPYREPSSNRIYFPVGSWRGWFTGVDLRLLQERGGRILKVHECMLFEPFNDLSDFASDLYARRLASTDTMSKLVLKLLLNSLYGKFGESAHKTSMVCYPDVPPQGDNVDMLFPGVFLVETEVEVKHAHVPFSAHITSVARKALYDYMSSGDKIYYCDTDGFACSNPNIPTGSSLGALKHEMSIRRGRFLRPKVYELESEDEHRVKAKGFTLSPDNELKQTWKPEERDRLAKEYSYDQFAKLVNGGELEVRRFYRIRELLKKGAYKPTEAYIRKRLQTETPKRCFDSSGDSRPWSINEINEANNVD